jgi:hypothetical protein
MITTTITIQTHLIIDGQYNLIKEKGSPVKAIIGGSQK